MDQDWYELLSLAIFARLYVGLRVLRDFSPIYAHRDELVAQASLPKLEAVSTLRIVYALNPARLLLCAFGLLFGILGFTMHVTERATNRDFHSFLVSYYFTWTTFTTVGYGDVVPRDKRGRVVAGVTCLVGLVFTALGSRRRRRAARAQARIVGLHPRRALGAAEAAASLIRTCGGAGASARARRAARSSVRAAALAAARRAPPPREAAAAAPPPPRRRRVGPTLLRQRRAAPTRRARAGPAAHSEPADRDHGRFTPRRGDQPAAGRLAARLGANVHVAGSVTGLELNEGFQPLRAPW